MKRGIVTALIIGAIVSATVIAAQVSGLLLVVEASIFSFVSRFGSLTRPLGELWQYLLIIVLAIIVSWLTIQTSQRGRLTWLLAALLLELATACAVCLLFHIFFQPLPSMLSVILAYAGAAAFTTVRDRGRGRVASVLFAERISPRQLARITKGELPLASTPTSVEATAVVCDIADKHDVADECEPAVFAELTEKFIAHATAMFLKAGAYIEAAAGEGVVAIFGFPSGDPQHAENATRAALDLVKSFEKLREASGDESSKLDVHVGVSSGSMIVGPVRNNGRAGLLATGEPVELARRFCIANRFYGSRVLIGPRTFELADKAIVARPIDFLSGVDVRERHEIFEPIVLSAQASPEDLSRRDHFWNGVVLYREKRWGEAYSRFQDARGPNDSEDAPLQLYLRRLEPLALQLSDVPLDE
ncbi:MAG: adenylate cyclase [Verrucomicrobiota bacterium]